MVESEGLDGLMLVIDPADYYTSDDLVDLIVDETLGPLVGRQVAAFEKAVAEFRTGDPLGPGSVEELQWLDPAEGILGLRVCDPAMGSGYFLVRVVDSLTDRVVGGIAEAEAAVDQYVSPLTERIRGIRATILKNAKEHGWTIDQSRIDDQRVVRRMVLKRCIFGVDKNPMAVELAKVALWLQTFTVGAPLNFLDHHIRYGNSLFGSSGLGRKPIRPAAGACPPSRSASDSAPSAFLTSLSPFATVPLRFARTPSRPGPCAARLVSPSSPHRSSGRALRAPSCAMPCTGRSFFGIPTNRVIETLLARNGFARYAADERHNGAESWPKCVRLPVQRKTFAVSSSPWQGGDLGGGRADRRRSAGDLAPGRRTPP